MTDKLPAPLLALFAPRPPVRYLEPADYTVERRRTPFVQSIGQFLQEIKAHGLHKYDEDYVPTKTAEELIQERKLAKKLCNQQKRDQQASEWNPKRDPNIHGDPFKTLFLCRLPYSITESEIDHIFGRYGPISSIRIVLDSKTQNPRGYAFIVYRHERDMKAAYRECNGIRIHDRRILVDVERGRTVKTWKPARLGGGLGHRHYTQLINNRNNNSNRGRGLGSHSTGHFENNYSKSRARRYDQDGFVIGSRGDDEHYETKRRRF